MVNIYEILQRAASLKEETVLNSISPERAGGIMYDTLLALNDLWLQQGSALVISKIYASVAAMEADTAPVSDLTGKPLRPGQIVVIASSDSDNGSVYRYNGTDAPSWSLVGAIGNLTPVDSLDSDSTQLPLAAHQGKVLDGKISQLGQEKVNIKKGWNLFNPEDTDVAIGYFIYNSSGVLSGGGTAVYNTSGYISVNPSTTYYKALNASKGFRFVLCYNADKEAISSSFINDDCNSFTTPENAAYVRITFYQNDYDYAQIASEEKVYQQYSEIGGYLENLQNVVTKQEVQIGIIEEKCADGTTVVTKTDTNGSQFLPSDFGLTKFEKGTILEVYGTTDGISFMFYGNRGSGNEQIIGYLSQDKYYPSSIVLEYDYVSLSSYSDNSTRTKTSVSLQSKLSYANDAINRIKDGHSQNVFQASKGFTSSGSETIQPSIFGLQTFEKGLTLEVYGETDGTTLLFYGNRGSGNELLIGKVSRDVNKPSILTLEDDYNSLVYYSNSATQTSIYISIYGKSSYVDKEIQDIKDSLNGPSCKVLYIGDSYTEMARWTTEFENMVNVSEKLNLGVSSADLKDIQSNITVYPYGSRPYNGILGSDGEEGNLNVFSSQIEQLKRIKAGNLHGILWKSVFSAPSANGTITFAFTEGTKTVNVLSTDSASDVAEKVAQISTSNYIITHPSGQNYVAIEALTNSVDSIPTISSSVVTISSGILKYKESYPFTSSPDVVIIAGGKNDLLDTDAKVESYQSQVVHQENVYYKRSSEQSSTQGTIYVPTSASDVDRTCFCGSLRHLIEEIHSLYENALIIVVGPSNLNYGGVNIDNDKKKDEQLSTAASYLSIPYISWFKNGIMCNRVFNKPSGSGTQDDPYILDSETDYTIDMMHPNYAGGKYLANNVAIIVKSYINNLI